LPNDYIEHAHTLTFVSRLFLHINHTSGKRYVCRELLSSYACWCAQDEDEEDRIVAITQYVKGSQVHILARNPKDPKTMKVLGTATVDDPQPRIPEGMGDIAVRPGDYVSISTTGVKYTKHAEKIVAECEQWKNYLTADWDEFQTGEDNDQEWLLKEIMDNGEDTILIWRDLIALAATPKAAGAARATSNQANNKGGGAQGSSSSSSSAPAKKPAAPKKTAAPRRGRR
jgi:hypothetical protein